MLSRRYLVLRKGMSGTSWAKVAATGVNNTPIKHTVVPASLTNHSDGSSKSFATQSADAERMAHRGREQRDPLVLSLRFNKKVLEELTAVRKQHFPPRNNNLEAHLTILHALPAEAREDMQQYLHETIEMQKAFRLSLGRIQVKPRIVLLPVRSKELNDTVHDIQQRFWDVLSDQDRSSFRQGHITLCNKRPEEEIAERGAEIESQLQGCEKWHCTGLGLDLWVYQGNRPWKHISYHQFQDQHG